MEQGTNSRGKIETFCSREHLKLDALKDRVRAAKLFNKYLSKPNIPAFPQPEFHLSHLQHDTDEDGLRGIKTDGGFKDPGYHEGRDFLVWWYLALKPEDLASAERRLLEETYRDITKDQDQDMDWEAPEQAQTQQQQGILRNFASSPVFTRTSMFGTYRFTFPVEEVLEAYSQQFCSGAPPVMRMYETVLFLQKVMYVVVVHGPDVDEYDDYPLLSENDPEAVCCYKDGHFIWRSQAMCETHWYELVKRPEINQMEAVKLPNKDKEFYVWDCVAIGLHIKRGEVLTFDRDRLRQTLKFCNKGARKLSRSDEGFQTFERATAIVQRLWPDHPSLEEDRSLQETPAAPVKTEPKSSD